MLGMSAENSCDGVVKLRNKEYKKRNYVTIRFFEQSILIRVEFYSNTSLIVFY